MRSGKSAAWAAATLLGVCALAPAAQAQDFFSQLFGGVARRGSIHRALGALLQG